MSRFAGFLAVVLVLALFVGLSAEVVLRFTLREPEVLGGTLSRDAYEPFEGVNFRHKPGYSAGAYRPGAYDTDFDVGREGLRQSSLDAQLRYPTRVLVLGDSFTIGMGVNEAEMYATLLAPPLNAAGAGVVNGAQAAFSITNMATYARHLFDALEGPDPKLVVFFSNFAEYNVRRDLEPRRVAKEVAGGVLLYRDRPFAGTFVDWFRTRSFAWMRLAHAWEESDRIKPRVQGILRDVGLAPPIETPAPGEEATPARMVDATMAVVRSFQDFCAERGAQVAFVRLPKRTPERGELQTLLAQRLRAADVAVLDLDADPSFSKDDFFEIDIHLNAQGHAKVAERVAPFVLATLTATTTPDR